MFLYMQGFLYFYIIFCLSYNVINNIRSRETQLFLLLASHVCVRVLFSTQILSHERVHFCPANQLFSQMTNCITYRSHYPDAPLYQVSVPKKYLYLDLPVKRAAVLFNGASSTLERSHPM